MKKKKQRLDRVVILNRTQFAKSRVNATINRAEKFTKDPEKKERLKEALCPVCFYLSDRCGGASMTTTECAHCEIEMTFSSTNTDMLCVNCATSLGLCKHCVSDLDLKMRRNFDFLKVEVKK